MTKILASDWLSEEEDQSREVLVYEGVLCQVARILASDWFSEASTLRTCVVWWEEEDLERCKFMKE